MRKLSIKCFKEGKMEINNWLKDEWALILGSSSGFGGEVSKKWFQNNFVGKEIYDDNILKSIVVAKAGLADSENLYEVDGISGATITSNGVTEFLKRDLKRYEKYFTQNK